MTVFKVCGHDIDYGILTYEPSKKEFQLHINKDIDIKEAPIMLSMYADSGIYDLTAEQSLKWVRMRITPPERANIGAILRSCGLTEYDEYGLLKAFDGRCVQDWLYLEEVCDVTLFSSNKQLLIKDNAPIISAGCLYKVKLNSITTVRLDECFKFDSEQRCINFCNRFPNEVAAFVKKTPN